MRRKTIAPHEPVSVFRPDQELEAAMETWGKAVWRLALAQTGSHAESEDVYQDVFIRLAKDQTVFTGPDHLKAWLMRTTMNRCHDAIRMRHRKPTLALDALPYEPTSCDPLPEDTAHDLWEAVEALPETMRVVVHLFYYEGYSGNEIATLMGLEPSTVRTRLQRARNQLRTTLGGVDHDEPRRLSDDDGLRAAASAPERTHARPYRRA